MKKIFPSVLFGAILILASCTTRNPKPTLTPTTVVPTTTAEPTTAPTTVVPTTTVEPTTAPTEVPTTVPTAVPTTTVVPTTPEEPIAPADWTYSRKLQTFIEPQYITNQAFADYIFNDEPYDFNEPVKLNAIFVSPAGTGEGTLDDPCSFQDGVDMAKAGQTVYLRAGTYSLNDSIYISKSGSANNYITIRNYPGEQPVVTADPAKLSSLGSKGEFIALSLDDNVSYIKIEGLEIANISTYNSYAICGWTGQTNIIIRNNKIHDIKTTSNKESDSNSSANAILLCGEKNVIRDVLIYGNEVYNNVTGWAESVSIAGNTEAVYVIENYVHDNTNIGIDFYGNAGYCKTPALDQPRYCVAALNKVERSVCSYADAAGLYVDGARDVLLTNNIICNSQYGIEIGSEEKQESYPVKNIVVRNNLVSSNLTCGIRVGGYETNATGYVYSTKIYNNTIIDSSDGESGNITISKVDGIDFRNNIIYSTANKPLIISDMNTSYVKNLTFKNNYIFVKNLSVDKYEFGLYNTNQDGLDAFNTLTGGNNITGEIEFDSNYRVLSGVTINAGDDTADSGSYDLGLNSRVVGSIDIGCYEAQDQAAIVELLIASIAKLGTVTLNSKADIEKLENTYNSLSAEYKAKITNYSILADARNTYNELLVAKLISDINALPAVTEANYESVLVMCNTIEADYNALSDSQKASVANISINQAKKEECILIGNTIAINEFKASFNTLPGDVSGLAEGDLQLVQSLIDDYNNSNSVVQASLTNEYNVLAQYKTYIKENLVTKEVFMYESEGSKIEKNTVIYSGNSFSIKLLGGGATPTATNATASDGTAFTACLLPGGSGRSFEITANKSGTIYLYVTVTDGSFSSKPGTVTYGDKSVDITSTKGTAYILEMDVVAGQVYTVTASANRLGLFAVIYE